MFSAKERGQGLSNVNCVWMPVNFEAYNYLKRDNRAVSFLVASQESQMLKAIIESYFCKNCSMNI